VVGEEGVNGIKIGAGDPAGEAYQEFQHAIKTLKERGIILALCSKNNKEDVLEVFSRREDMPLCLDDFLVLEVNWDNKHENIKNIANKLHISTDSMVFIDDNPAECDLVRKMLPEVHTIQLPDDPAEYADLLRKLNLFEKSSITEEDRNKTQLYKQNAKRVKIKDAAANLEEYLESLGTIISIKKADHENIDRIHQLFSKTNQFNLTTIRYDQGNIIKFINDNSINISIVSARDNYGSMGIIGLYLVKTIEKKAVIDSFIMSCRAIGRGIETAIMNKIKKEYLIKGTLDKLEAQFIPTRKNTPARNYLSEQGFTRIHVNNNCEEMYCLDRKDTNLMPCPGINIEDQTWKETK